MAKGYKVLSWAERLKIEALNDAGIDYKEIARQLGRNKSTIWRELQRGKYKKLTSDYLFVDRYSADMAQAAYEYSVTARGRDLKVGNNHKAVKFIETLIKRDGYSPYAAAQRLTEKADKYGIVLCTRTIYNYIDMGIFQELKLDDLPCRKHKKRAKRKIQKRASRGTSIEKRPKHIEERIEIGHWEMDTVVGKHGGSKKTLLVLTERKSRMEIIMLMRDRTTKSVVRSLNRLERRFGAKLFKKLFRTITVDNGTEFSDYTGLEKSKYSSGKRTSLFYCHAYSSWERGSNENTNRLVRRFFPKGTDFDCVRPAEVKRAEMWINNYPRKVLEGHSSNDIFLKETGLNLVA